MNKDNERLAISDIEIPELRESAGRIADFNFESGAEYGSEQNVIGLRADSRIFSRRLDSTTIFARDEDCGIGRALGTWTGAKRPIETACRRVLRSAGIPRNEIANVTTVTEYGGTVDVDAAQKEVDASPEMLRRVALAERVVAGATVWSSHCTVELTAEGKIGAIELHWPSIPPEVEAEAIRLQWLAMNDFEPRTMAGGEVESVEVGIVHSPSIGFFMDVRPVIRVIYRSTERGLGRKAVAHLDRHGHPVDAPRSITPIRPETADGDRRPPNDGPKQSLS